MPFCIISDIHSNIEAFETVLEDIKKQEISEIICLGDLVGYGASPNECVELARSEKISCISGNHDRAATTLKNLEYYNEYAKQAILWTNKTLTAANKEFLANRPTRIVAHNTLFIHGALTSKDDYIFSAGSATNNIKLMAKQYPEITRCFFGHTHIKIIFSENGATFDIRGNQSFHLDKETRYMVNPGSVGQPRDGDNRASYTIFDETTDEVKHFLLDYDITAAQQKICKAGLPGYLAERLQKGK